MGDEAIEQTLFLAKEVQVYTIPPRPSSGGHKSGEWKVADRIFEGRLRVLSIGERCELRLEEPSSGELFAMCPVPLGQRAVAVEPVADSSRYFVLRLEDATTRRHAFIGMGFTDRTEAFDFNVALSDHEKYIRRAKEVQAAAKEDAPSTSAEAATLYKKQDLSLKEGETIKINMRRTSGDKAATSSGGLFSKLPAPPSSSQSTRLMPLAPPVPKTPVHQEQASATPGQHPSQLSGDLLGLGGDTSTPAVQQLTGQLDASHPFGTQTATVAKKEENWASFD
ncbi:g7418 [Coccomyxa elongata]